MRLTVGRTLLAAGTVLALAGVGMGTASAGGDARTARPVTAPGVCPVGAAFDPPLPSATMRATLIREGFNFLEGPVWDAASGSLLLSDMGNATGTERVQPSTIRRFTAPATFDTFVANAGSNGLALTPDGTQLVAATHDLRTVSTYRLADKVRGEVATRYQNRRFNSPNDVTVRSDGTVYFTDPNFQRGNRRDELNRQTGVYRVRLGAGTAQQVSLVDGSVAQPNGIVLSPDEKTLYVGGNTAGRIYKYPVNPDGSTGPRTDFAAVLGADGATVDCAGNIYWTSYNDGLVHVFSPAGVKLGTISAGRNTTNVAFGGADRRTLFITSGTYGNFGLYSVQLRVPGNPY